MRLLTPKIPGASGPKAKSRSFIWAALGLLLFSLVYYLPSLNPGSEFDDPLNLNNLPNALSEAYLNSYIYGPYLSSDNFYPDWLAGREIVRSFQVPLWYDRGGSSAQNQLPFSNNYCVTPCPDYRGGRAILADSSAPLFYPLSLLYYVFPGNGLALFMVVHLWLFGLGLLLLTRKWGRWRYAGWLIPLLMLPIGGLLPPILAALAWLPFGMWLLAGKKWAGRWLFALVVGLMFLAANWVLPLIFTGVALAWGLVYAIVQERARLGRTLKLTLYLLVMVLLGAGIAGPQLFPRLVSTFGEDKSVSFVPAPPNIPYGLRISALDSKADANKLPYPPKAVIGYSPVQITQNGRTVRIDLIASPNSPAFELAFAQRYASGWSATVYNDETVIVGGPEQAPQGNKNKGKELKVKPTSENWRAVQITPDPAGGRYLLYFRYNPMSFTLGLYAVFLSLAAIAMGFVALAWGRFYREDADSHPVRRVAKNSLTPLLAQLLGKGLDFGFALFSLRLLGPDGNGRYTIAVTTWLILATLTDFGLETIITREVARDRSFENANRHYVTMLFTRFGTAVLAFPAAMLWIGGFSLTGNMASDTAWAIGLLLIGFIPGSFSSTMTAIFRGYEKYEFLAAIQIMTAIIRVPFGLGALLAGWGVVGLAGASVVVNFITAAALAVLFRREIFKPRYRHAYDWKLARTLLVLSYPLVLNSLLNNILFKSDALLLGAIKGDTEVGLYNAAYKFVDAVLIIPSAFTLALFPLLSSYASSSKVELKRAYTEGLRLLLIIGLPISAGVMFVAHDLIGALGGSEYLPGAAVCLQILIWFLPFSYVNGLTQYVLIALNKQRLITVALIVTASVNVGLNLLLMPLFGYYAASAMTIVSELFMLVPFSTIAMRELGSVPFWKILWRPLLASLVMIAGLFLLTAVFGLNYFLLTVPVGGLLYITSLILTRTFTANDLRMFKKIFSRG